MIFLLKRDEMMFMVLLMDMVEIMDSMFKEMLLVVSSVIIFFCFLISLVKLKLDFERKCCL